jgi:hypothetical protein
MIYALFILMFGFSIGLAFSEGYNFIACLYSFMFNAMAYSVFILFLAGKTYISKPSIDIKAGITDEKKLRKTVISCSKLIAKNSFLWFLLCCLPFVFYTLIHKDILNQIGPVTIFVIVNGLLATAGILVLSTVLLLYFEKMCWALLSISGIVFTSFIAFVPQTELSLLFFFSAVIIITYFLSFFLIRKKRFSQDLN